MNNSKWMYTNRTHPRIYQRHPDTGDSNYRSAYASFWNSTEQSIIKLYENHGWVFLRKEDECTLIFIQEIKK